MSESVKTTGALGPDHGYGPDIDHVLLSEEQIQAKIGELAAQIAEDYAGREVLLVGVLKGAVLFMSDFARALQIPTQMEFMAVSSYGSATSSSGVVRILKDLDRDIAGRHVLIIEDIIDSGLTLSWLLKNLESRQPVSTMLYSRYGIVPQVPLYWMTHLPGIEGLLPLAPGVHARPIALETDGEAIDALDRALLGYARPQDHRMWVRTSKTARVYLGDDGSLAGYGYHGSDDWLTPLAARDEALVAGMIRDLLEAHTGPTTDLVVQISGGSVVLLPQLLAAGMRSDEGAQMIYSSTGRVPGPGYLLYAGYHP